jgi:Protein of unknown function (DUF3631).
MTDDQKPTPPALKLLQGDRANAAKAGKTRPAKVSAKAKRLDGAELLDKVKGGITCYVVMPSEHAADAATLWAAATHAQESWEHATRLVLNSPMKRCAKSRLQDILSELSRCPLVTVNATVAAIFRAIDPDDPLTLFIDEADTIFGKTATNDSTEDLRGLLNSGFARNRPVLRCVGVGSKQESVEFPTYSMACLAAIGNVIPDTVTDRAVTITMRRRLVGETVKPFRMRRDGVPLRRLGEELGEWVRAHLATLEAAEPELPVEDRAADVWEPLVAIADLAGGDWPKRARAACMHFTDEAAADDDTIAIKFLVDLRAVLTEPAMTTNQIVTRMLALNESPWARFEFTEQDLARRLKPYGLRSHNVRLANGKQAKGYRLEDLVDTFTRYAPPVENEQEAL